MNKLRSAKKFVSDHRVGLAVTTTSIFWIVVFAKQREGLNDFLKEHDLFEKYYTEETV